LMLKMTKSGHPQKVTGVQVQDYRIFRNQFATEPNTSELRRFEHFYAARSLLGRGMETYLNAVVSDIGGTSRVTVDACGITGGSITVVCCEGEEADPSLGNVLELVNRSENAQAIILAPPSLNSTSLEERLPEAFHSGKIVVESLGWFQDQLDHTLRETLRLVDLLGNETRIRMLTPLFRKTSGAREYRATINPKLVYQNLPILLEARMVRETEGNYELSELGKTILAEFITFLEKTRKALNQATTQEEVKHE
jgi:hypothetical protein